MADEFDQPETDGWGLVMPFVACRSHGGPYDDDAFVAGFQVGQINRALAAIAALEGDGLTAMVRADLAAQLDLIAMQHGFPHVERTEHDGHWMTWTCRREATQDGGPKA